MSMELLDDQLRWLLRHGYAVWHCYRCKQTQSTHIGMYYHLVDFHGLDPQSAFKEGEAGSPRVWDSKRREYV